MKDLSRHIRRVAVVVAFAAAAFMTEAAPALERVAGVSQEVSESVGADYYEVRVADRAVILTVVRKTNVKVFTILGQLVADKQLEAGTWRLPLTDRGIYILKVGSSTRRITL